MILHASPWASGPQQGPQGTHAQPSGPLGAPVVQPWPLPPHAALRGGRHQAWATAPATLQVARRANTLLRQRRAAQAPGTGKRSTRVVAALGGGIASYVLVRILLGRFAHPPRSKA